MVGVEREREGERRRIDRGVKLWRWESRGGGVPDNWTGWRWMALGEGKELRILWGRRKGNFDRVIREGVPEKWRWVRGGSDGRGDRGNRGWRRSDGVVGDENVDRILAG